MRKHENVDYLGTRATPICSAAVVRDYVLRSVLRCKNPCRRLRTDLTFYSERSRQLKKGSTSVTVDTGLTMPEPAFAGISTAAGLQIITAVSKYHESNSGEDGAGLNSS